jgi:hypothetical protein
MPTEESPTLTLASGFSPSHRVGVYKEIFRQFDVGSVVKLGDKAIVGRPKGEQLLFADHEAIAVEQGMSC